MSGRKTTTEDLWAQAEANGYKRGARTEVDQIRGGQKYISKTKKDHDRTLQRYIHWHLRSMREDHDRKGLPPPDEDTARGQHLGEGVPCPNLLAVKDFLRFYVATSKSQIDKQKPTADSICTIAEWFFAGFTRVTGTDTNAEDRSEVYYWIRRTLVLEGVVVNKHRAKHNFTVRDLTRVLLALWTYDDLIFIHERYRIQTTFLIHVYCWTGARIGAFFKGGLRYKDVTLILQRDHNINNDRGWRLVYKIDQRWVKNNRDPDNIVFGAAAKEHQKLFYNDAGFLLIMAIADGALFGYNSVDEVRQQIIPTGEDEVELRFNDSALAQPILRKCAQTGGLTDDPMPKGAFIDIFKSSLVNAGYLWGLSIHAIRRQLGKGADRRNTTVERSQHLTQADPTVFGQSYVANCSSVDGQAAFRDEDTDRRHIEYFQSLEKFHEDGLPDQLPARLEEELEQDPHLRELETQVRVLMGVGGDNQAFSTAKRQVTNYRRRLKRESLRLYQQGWVQERRDWKVLTRGKEVAGATSKTELAESIYTLFPERRRLAEKMASPHPLTSDQMWDALRDLHSLCLEDSDVLYLPGSRHLNGTCPVKSCRHRINSLPKCQRNQHIQACVRQEMATRLGRLLSDINYCYLCFDWVVGDAWEPHCQAHLDARPSTRCGAVTYRHTSLRPAYCPFCVNKTSLPASERLKPWSRDHKLWIHVDEEHLTDCRWPLVCPYKDPLCDASHEDAASFQFHLMDVHRLSRSHPSKAAHSIPGKRPPDKNGPLAEGTERDFPGRKRKSSICSEDLKWMPPQSLDGTVTAPADGLSYRSHKRRRRSTPTRTICPEVIVIDDDVSDGQSAQSAVDFKQFTNPSPGLEDNDSYTDLEAGPFTFYCTTSHKTIHALAPTEVEDGSDLDVVFEQYVRSPSFSPSPSPDDAASGLSGTTLIDPEPDQGGSVGGAEPSKEPSREGIQCPAPQYVSGTHGAGHQVDISHAHSGPRIRLRVSRPKIMLRLRLPATRQAKTKEKKRGKGKTERQGTQREKGNKEAKSRKAKRAKR